MSFLKWGWAFRRWKSRLLLKSTMPRTASQQRITRPQMSVELRLSNPILIESWPLTKVRGHIPQPHPLSGRQSFSSSPCITGQAAKPQLSHR